MRASLIVNADDWGLSRECTDRIAECFRRGAITSTTALVWMADSSRAADIARERLLPVGLHVNLDTPLDDRTAPATVRRAHEQVRAWYANPRRPALLYNPSPRFQRLVDDCLLAQLEEFGSRYGRAPTHLDGHHHVQLAWNVLLSPVLGQGLRMRATYWPSRRPLVRAVRGARLNVLRRRFAAPDRFYNIRDIHPAWNGRGLDVLEAANHQVVEIMVHPGLPDELEVLLSDEWIQAIRTVPLAPFDQTSGLTHALR